jgi:chemotaxis protein MotB
MEARAGNQQGSQGMNMGMNVVRRAAAVLALAGFLGGCANQQVVDSLRDANRSLTDRNAQLTRQVQELQNENALMQRQRTAADTALAELQRQLADARGNEGKLRQAMADFDARFKNLNLGPLDPDTDKALAELASQHPDLITYDQARGMLRFASDLTFDSGQDAVKESARASLAALAKILTGASASNYEVMIVGHTDSQPISAATASRGHPTNVHLSCHRAIAVRKELAALGVPAAKMFAAGWGEFRPAVPNTTSGNTPQNRRVEIFLTRPTGTSLGEAAPQPAPKTDKPATRQPDITK